MDVWSWICELTDSDEWAESHSPLVFELASSRPSRDESSTQSIQLRASRSFGADSDEFLTFSVCLQGFRSSSQEMETILWVSDACPLSSDKPFLPLVLQLLQEIVSRSPSPNNSTCPRSQLQQLKPYPVSWFLDSHSSESLSSFFSLIFLARLFWLCVFDAPSEVGSFYFHSLLYPNLKTFTTSMQVPILRTFLILVGVDVELCLMRTIGYMLAKWFLVREVGAGLQSLTPLPSENLGFSYATESHGLWVMKGYSPIWAMTRTGGANGQKNQFNIIEAKESVLRYALAHHQLEAVIQLEYSVKFNDGFILVNARIDNLRFNMAKLGFHKTDDDVYADERHFPSRIRVWVGPEIGSSSAASLSLGRSTENGETQHETQKILKGSFGKLKVPKVKAMSRTSTKTRTRNWRWDQDAEGNAAIFESVFCDNMTGTEIATGKPPNDRQSENSVRNRYAGARRAFTKSGGLVLAGDECGESVGWRLSREMEGSVLKWRIGCRVWVSYWPNCVKTSYWETRCVEWCDEVDLPLIPSRVVQ